MSIDTPQILSRPPPVKHVVMYSGGIGSWAAAKRVIDRHGSDNIVLLFTRTRLSKTQTYIASLTKHRHNSAFQLPA